MTIDEDSTFAKNFGYFQLLPNLAQRKFINLANHRPSFMPYKAVVLALEFLKRESQMASRSGTSRGGYIPIEEAIRMIQDQESGTGGLLSDEESDLDQQLYDMDEKRR